MAVNRSDAVTLAGIISGTGALSQIGAGTTILTGANTYTGATTITAGTLQIGNGGTTGQLGTGALTNNGTLAVNRSNAITLAGIIAGTGALSQIGTGTTILTGANTYTGATTISAGTLQIGNGGTTGSLGTGAVTNNGTLAVNRSNTLILSGPISGTGILSQIGAGTTILTAANTYTGTTTISAGTLQIGNGGTSGSLGTGAVTNNANLAFNRSDSVTYAGAITGTGGLQQTGAGTLILTGASTFTGPTSVNAGTLVVNGSLASAVNILAGARLGGNGSVGSLTVNGVLAPGSSPGTLTVNGNLTFGAGGVYIADVQAAVADRLTVTGTAALAGTLQLNPLNGPYSFATPYTLLSAAGGLGGTTFGTVSTVGAFGSGVNPTVSYTSTSVLLTLAQNNLVPLLPTGTLINPRNVALGVDAAVAGGANPSALFAVFNLPAASLPAALNTLSGEVQTTRRATGVAVSDQFLRVLLDPNAAIERGAAPGKNFAFWVAPFGLRNTTDGDGGVDGSADRRVTSTNVAFGLDVRAPGNTVLGAAVSFGNANATLAQARGTASADIFEVGAHASTRLDRLSLGAGFSYSQISADTTRAIPTLGIAAINSSEDSTVFGGRVEAAYEALNFGWANVSLLAAGRIISVTTPALLETAPTAQGFAALAVRRQTDTSTRTEASIKFATPAVKALDGFLQLGWGHNFDQALDLNARLSGLPGSDFTAFGARGDSNAGLARAGVNYDVTKNFTLGARLEGQFAQDFRETTWSVNLRYRF